jgi:hypothetical protein
MPSVAGLRLGESPRQDPLSYPGRTVNANYLWLDGWIYDTFPVAGAGLPEWGLRVDGGPLAAATPRVGRLDDALAAIGAAAMAARRPVIAFGSNAAPAQLLDKFSVLPAQRRVVPVMRASITGLSLSHSAHVSPPGYIPYVLVERAALVDGAAAVLMADLLWLDQGQLRVLNPTEPNYRLAALDRYPLAVDSGQVIASYLAYQGKWGALRWAPDATPAAAGSQLAVFDGLSGMNWFTTLVGSGAPSELVFRLRTDAALRDAVRIELARRGLVAGDGLGAEQVELDYRL